MCKTAEHWHHFNQPQDQGKSGPAGIFSLHCINAVSSTQCLTLIEGLQKGHLSCKMPALQRQFINWSHVCALVCCTGVLVIFPINRQTIIIAQVLYSRGQRVSRRSVFENMYFKVFFQVSKNMTLYVFLK